MEFRLSITLGTDAMQSYADLRAALAFVRHYLKEYRGKDEAFEPGDNAPIRDEHSNVVGRWEVTTEDERAERVNRAFNYMAQQRYEDEHADDPE